MKTLSDTLMQTAVAAGFLCAVAAPPASAGVIYNGGSPDHGGQLYAQSPAAVAMSFTLPAGSNVLTDAHWWGGCFPATTCGPAPDFTIAFLADNGGSPGAFLAIGDFGTANQTATGNLIGGTGGWEEYAYNVTFAPYGGLTAGTPYWFYIQETAAEPSGAWGAETTSTGPTGQLAAQFNVLAPDAWTIMPETLAFNLTGPGGIPEPSSWAMILTGFAGLGLVGSARAKLSSRRLRRTLDQHVKGPLSRRPFSFCI